MHCPALLFALYGFHVALPGPNCSRFLEALNLLLVYTLLVRIVYVIVYSFFFLLWSQCPRLLHGRLLDSAGMRFLSIFNREEYVFQIEEVCCVQVFVAVLALSTFGVAFSQGPAKAPAASSTVSEADVLTL